MKNNQRADRRSTPSKTPIGKSIINDKKSTCNSDSPMVPYNSQKGSTPMDMIENQFVCVCHGMPAWLETDYKYPHWVCEIDDRVCEVIVGVA